MLQINASEFYSALQAVSRWLSRDDTRPHLHGVFVGWNEKAERVDIVATNGHALARWRSESGRVENDDSRNQFLIHADGVKQLTKTLKPLKSTLSLYGKDDKVHVVHETFKSVIPDVDAQFPPYERVIPERINSSAFSEIGIDAFYLAEVAKTFGTSRRKAVPLHVSLTGNHLDPMLFTSPDVANLTVVVMPMRVESVFTAHEQYKREGATNRKAAT